MIPKRILLTGINGQVGHALLSELANYELVSVSRDELDFRQADSVKAVIREIKPDLIINPAAYTAVDRAESEPDLAYAINATAPRIIAEEAARLGCALIHFSTDYVYDGRKQLAYLERDPVNPQSVYGKSKLAGEEAIQAVGLPHLILRTSWVYGAHGKNFLKTILRLASERETLGIVADQIGAPTSSDCIAKAVARLIQKWSADEATTGVYHFTNTGETSWHGFACEIVKQHAEMQRQPALMVDVANINPLTTAEYPTPAARPANSRLSAEKLKQVFGFTLPSWQEGLRTEMQAL